jgi:hypothetical protein
MEKKFFGLTTKYIKRMAFSLAIRNNLCHPFSKISECAGKKWLANFLKRHPDVALRKPQTTSFTRVKGFTLENVATFFGLFESEMEKIHFPPISFSMLTKPD